MKQYLGDGVYVEIEHRSWRGERLRLTAEDGIRPTDIIYLEPEVLAAFLKYVSTLRTERTTAGTI